MTEYEHEAGPADEAGPLPRPGRRESDPVRLERTLVAYLRVSTERQMDGYGLEVQQSDVHRWAERNGRELVATYVDEAVSGSLEAYDRPALTEALAAVRDGADLLVPKLDRLARSLTVQEAVLKLVWDAGGLVFTCDGGEVPQDDPDDPMRTALRQMQGVFAQLERALIAKRLRDGRKAKAALGGYAFGAPPYGWESVDGVLVEIPEQQEIRRHLAAWRNEGLPFRTVAERANAAGFVTRRGCEWTPGAVHRVLRKA